MMRNGILGAVMVLASFVPAVAQGRGLWRAASSSARSVTGDVAFSDTKITINFASFTIAQIRALTPEEMGAQFDADTNAGGNGALFRLSVPATVKFLGHNTLCGSETTQWMATYVAGRSLQIAFFSNSSAPVMTVAAMEGSTSLCGVYTYSR